MGKAIAFLRAALSRKAALRGLCPGRFFDRLCLPSSIAQLRAGEGGKMLKLRDLASLIGAVAAVISAVAQLVTAIRGPP